MVYLGCQPLNGSFRTSSVSGHVSRNSTPTLSAELETNIQSGMRASWRCGCYALSPQPQSESDRGRMQRIQSILQLHFVFFYSYWNDINVQNFSCKDGLIEKEDFNLLIASFSIFSIRFWHRNHLWNSYSVELSKCLTQKISFSHVL